MTDEQYRVWKRRMWHAEHYEIDAKFAEESGAVDLAANLRERSSSYFTGAKEMANQYTGQWVLALPRPDNGLEFAVAFHGNNGLTVDPTEAVLYESYLAAIKARHDFATGPYYSPEPFNYHLGRAAKTGEF